LHKVLYTAEFCPKNKKNFAKIAKGIFFFENAIAHL